MYRIAIYNITGSGTPIVQFLEREGVVVQGWSKQISAPGKFTFSVPIGNTKATATNLQKYLRVRLYRERRDNSTFDPVWFGYINASKMNGDMIDVECVGMLQLFTKRYTTANQAFTGQGSTDAFSLITQANSDSATGVVNGTGGVTNTQNLVENYYTIYRAWQDMAAATLAEFEIDDSGNFNFVPSLGTDRSTPVSLIFRRDGVPGSNLATIEYGEDGAPMANRIFGATTAGSLTSQKDDASSQATYGLLVERKQLDVAQNQASLDNLTQSYLTQRSSPATDYRVQMVGYQRTYNPVTNTFVGSGYQYSDINLGDLVKVTIITENQNIQQAKRVAMIEVQVDVNGDEKIFYTLSKSGIYLTAAMVDQNTVPDIKRRLAEIDAQL